MECTKDEMIGMSARDVMDLNPVDIVKAASHYFTGKPGRGQTLITKSGKKIFIRGVVYSLTQDGEPFLVATDIQVIDKKPEDK